MGTSPTDFMIHRASAPIQPWDSHNQKLVSNVHPSGWANPTPSGRYNLVVIGAGTAGLVTAAGAVGLGARVALIEKHFMGGDCLNTGCVPSKALLRASRAAASVREASQLGIDVPRGTTVDFARIMERVRRLRADISPHDSARRFSEMGVEMYFGSARFSGPKSIDVAGQTLEFSNAVIATGARPAIPNLPGLDDVPYLTNETLFELTELPRCLGIIGAGPIGCEMAQAFARLGSEVYLIGNSHGILPREERDAAEIVRKALEADGVRILCCAKELRVSRQPSGIRLAVESHGKGFEVPVSQLLVATGRSPNVEGLGLEAAGVAFSQNGVQVDDRLQTTQSGIYACGDVCSRFQFTHAADFMARTVIQNALFMGRARASALQIPRATYTSPEIAQIGLTLAEAETKGLPVSTFTQPFSALDRAILDDRTEGFVRIHARKGTDQIVGATIVAENAGDLISEISVAMKNRIGLGSLGSVIHPYPTQAEAIRKLGDAYNRTRLTPFVQHLMERWLAWRR